MKLKCIELEWDLLKMLPIFLYESSHIFDKQVVVLFFESSLDAYIENKLFVGDTIAISVEWFINGNFHDSSVFCAA